MKLRFLWPALVGLIGLVACSSATSTDRDARVAPTPPPEEPAPPPPSPSRYKSAGHMSEGRVGHTATLLEDGRVVVVGGEGLDRVMLKTVEIFDPSTRKWTPGASMPAGRSNHSATRLADGKVLVAGGGRANAISAPDGNEVRADALLYDPVANSWTATGALAAPRSFHTAVALNDGRVLVAGGGGDKPKESFLAGAGGNGTLANALATAEVFDPKSGTWSAAASMTTGRYLHTATALADGRVIVAGGANENQESFATAEIFDPKANAWSAGGAFSIDRARHAAALLPSGRVMIAAGKKANVAWTPKVELLDVGTGAWSQTAALDMGRTGLSLTRLPNGKVLTSGGSLCGTKDGCSYLAQSALYDEETGTWQRIGDVADGRAVHVATLLASGEVLLTGGFASFGVLDTAEIAIP